MDPVTLETDRPALRAFPPVGVNTVAEACRGGLLRPEAAGAAR